VIQDLSPDLLRRLALASAIATLGASALAQGVADAPPTRSGKDPFRQLEELLPTPNAYRTASGAPGHAYWQQKVDYQIEIALDEQTRRLTGTAQIDYANNSPDELRYLWLQLDNNLYASDSAGALIAEAPGMESIGYRQLRAGLARASFEGGLDIGGVRDADGAPLPYTISGTMMRIDLPATLVPQDSTSFELDWSYTINNSKEVRARSGAEHFEEDDNWLFEVAHWFPRLAAYTDVNGWQNKQFLGRGEFTLEFGDYVVAITVPAVVGVRAPRNRTSSRASRARAAARRMLTRPSWPP